jgi:hypothetical protein
MTTQTQRITRLVLLILVSASFCLGVQDDPPKIFLVQSIDKIDLHFDLPNGPNHLI